MQSKEFSGPASKIFFQKPAQTKRQATLQVRPPNLGMLGGGKKKKKHTLECRPPNFGFFEIKITPP